MTELYENISNEVKKTAATMWDLAFAQHDPIKAADFLNNVTEYYSHLYTEEEMEFLRFYFQMKMEMMKE